MLLIFSFCSHHELFNDLPLPPFACPLFYLLLICSSRKLSGLSRVAVVVKQVNQKSANFQVEVYILGEPQIHSMHFFLHVLIIISIMNLSVQDS